MTPEAEAALEEAMRPFTELLGEFRTLAADAARVPPMRRSRALGEACTLAAERAGDLIISAKEQPKLALARPDLALAPLREAVEALRRELRRIDPNPAKVVPS